MQQWLIYRDDQPIGPMSASDLKRLAANGELTPSDIVGLAGSSERFTASKVNGLFPQNSSPPPLPQNDSQPKDLNAKRVVESFRSFASDAKEYATERISAATAAAREASDAERPLTQAHQQKSTIWDLLNGMLHLPVKEKAILAIIWLLPGLAISSCLRMPSVSIPGAVTQARGTIPMTVDELRKELQLGTSFKPKSKFYEKYGKPKRTMTLGDAVYLLYECEDNPVRIECSTGNFKWYDEIVIMSLDET